MIRPKRHSLDVVVRWTDELLRQVQMGVSIWGAVHSHLVDKWALSGAGAQALRHGILETVWFFYDEAQQVGLAPKDFPQV